MAGKSDRSAYQSMYYEKKRESRSEERKRRYREDPEYREKVKERAKMYRAKKAEERARQIAEGIIPKRKKQEKTVDRISVSGKMVNAYTITEVAHRVGRSFAALKRWSYLGVLPETPYRSERGNRLYTDAMIMVIKTAILMRGRVKVKDRSFYDDIVEGWRGFGVEI